MTRRRWALVLVAITLSGGALTACDPPKVVCSTVTFTPPGTTARLGRLCEPHPLLHDTAIMLVHGGGGVSGDRFGMQAWSQRYGVAGYPTLSIDYFLFDNTTPPPVYPIPERDVKAGVQYLRRHAAQIGVDPERIVVHGASAGARLSAEMLVTPEDPYFFGAQMWPGTPDHVNGLVGFYGPYNGAQQDFTRYYGGPPNDPDPAVRDRWARANSVARAGDATGPSILFNGDADDRVPVAWMTEFEAALDAGGQTASSHVVAGAGHGFDHPGSASGLSPQGEAAAKKILYWLDKKFPD